MTAFTFLLDDVPGGGNAIRAIELPAVSPALAGVLVGAVAGVAVFVLVLLLFSRRKPVRRLSAGNQVVVIAPYATLSHGSSPSLSPAHPSSHPPASEAGVSTGFVPSSPLSARAFAKMGYAFGQRVPGAPLDPYDDDVLSEDDLVEDPDDVVESGCQSVGVAPVVVLGPRSRGPEESAPHPLGIIRADSAIGRALTPPSTPVVMTRSRFAGNTQILERTPELAAAVGAPPSASSTTPPASVSAPVSAPASSAPPSASGRVAVSTEDAPPSGAHPRAVPIDDLSFDDSPTEFGEPFFDEPPQPPTRGSRPKIRPIRPAPPRFCSSQSLPAVAAPRKRTS